MSNTVLIVEDDVELLDLFGQMLRYADYDVMLAANGTEATVLLKQHSSEIILLITDILMPKMSGHDLSAWCNKNYPQIPCLKISGCFEAPPGVGPDEFLEKPFTEKQLLESVRLALNPIGFRIAL